MPGEGQPAAYAASDSRENSSGGSLFSPQTIRFRQADLRSRPCHANMLMLCLVFAAAGPWMPGAGDVSPMDPTIAYGAAPNLLVFAPDGGAGFDLGGQDSFDVILTSWNTTIAGPLGTTGAQNVNPPIPKGPMAVRATPWGRNGGVFEIVSPRRLDHCSNSTSGTRAATEVTDAWVKPENCATNS